MTAAFDTDWIAARARGSAVAHVKWLAAAALVGFLVPFVSVDLGALPRGWFVLAHALVTGTFLVIYARWAGFRPGELWLNWPLGVILAVLAAAFSVNFVLSQPASLGVQGLELAWSLFWLGFAYGLIDALLLTVVPVYSAWCIARQFDWLARWRGKLLTAGLSLLASGLVTITYHLGFPEFQGPGIIQPVIGNAVFSFVYVLSASPLAPLISHTALHVAAVLHALHTSAPLPPHA